MSISKLKTHPGSNIEEIPLWTEVSTVESQALDQLRNIASLPWLARLSVMPDVHLGKGATVGSVIGMRGAVSPAAVGVDIGCGMGAVKTNLKADKVKRKASDLRGEIEKLIPVGFNSHDKGYGYDDVDKSLHNEVRFLAEDFTLLTDEVQDDFIRTMKQVGTLGGGNHFIEVNVDSEGNVWLMLHSGSRWIGKTLAEVHMKKAMKLEHNVGIKDKALAAFLSNTPEMEAYRRDLYWAQQYAMVNRKVMMSLLKEAVMKFWPGLQTYEEVWCHHNYVAEEVHYGEKLFVTRKGAINADRGRMGIIPGAMGCRSYIVRGKGCEEALASAPHGAGRKLSRGAAKRKFTVKDLIEQTNGVECRKDKGVIDEIPGAYKNIDTVIQQSSELVEVVATLEPALICVKG